MPKPVKTKKMGNPIAIPKYRIGQEVFLVDKKIGIAKAKIVDFVRAKDGEVRYVLSKQHLLLERDGTILYVGSRTSIKKKFSDIIKHTIPAPESLLFVVGETLSRAYLFLNNPLIPQEMKGIVFEPKHAQDVRDGYRVVFNGIDLITLGKTKK